MQQETSTTPTKPKKTTSTNTHKRRRRKGGLNFLLFIGIIGAVALFFWAEQQRRDALSQLEETQAQLEEIKESTERSGQQVADEVLSKLRTHIEIASDPQPTVATIIDVERLRETSDFYKTAKNGDNLILTETRAILFDPERNIIIDVVPVVLDAENTSSEEADNTTQPQDKQNSNQEETQAPNDANNETGPDTQAIPADGNVPADQ